MFLSLFPEKKESSRIRVLAEFYVKVRIVFCRIFHYRILPRCDCGYELFMKKREEIILDYCRIIPKKIYPIK